MPLYAERKRRERRDEAEAAGGDFWTTNLAPNVRNKLIFAVEDALDSDKQHVADVHRMVLEALGAETLQGQASAGGDLLEALRSGGPAIVFSIIEATYRYLEEIAFPSPPMRVPSHIKAMRRFRERVSEILRENRVKFDFIKGEIVDLESQLLHTDVVEPTLRLLAGDSKWSGTEKAFLDALSELHNGKGEDAITDAAVALEEALSVHGCSGNNLSKKIQDGIKRGILAPHDKPLGAWLGADRSETGDSHNPDEAARDDGWLYLYVVGAVILRLSKGPRGTAA